MTPPVGGNFKQWLAESKTTVYSQSNGTQIAMEEKASNELQNDEVAAYGVVLD